jgi:NDP-4-keto-2,6-dideoxyhexose 3-C-methyltransferase
MSKKIKKCRVCGNNNLVQVVDLGQQYLTGVFPQTSDEKVSKGQLALVKCHSNNSMSVCSLLQLSESFNLDEMYGDNYGYRSGLNTSMVKHLKAKVEHILSLGALEAGDVVVDIGANDGTTLGFYPSTVRRIGVDPTGEKFRKYYQSGIELIPDFFSSESLLAHTVGRKPKIITSFSMFYDLEYPIEFCKQIANVLDEEGLWIFEQSYMPTMLEKKSFDTICHEHLEYYGLEQVIWILNSAGLKVIDVELNGINGGSFSVTAVHKSSIREATKNVQSLLLNEAALKMSTLAPYKEFNTSIQEAKSELNHFLQECKGAGKSIAALGASTKGNVLLQYLNLTSSDLIAIGEVNPDKFGRLTPGSHIPIVNESDLLLENIDYFIVLPWHFRDYFVECSRYKGKKLIFPLPRLEIVSL